MEPIFDYPVQFNSYLVGKWRMTLKLEFKGARKKEITCYRYFGDIVEM